VKLLAALLLLFPFTLKAQDERPAPFITTPDEVVEGMLRLAGTGPQDFVIDLGSGDGRIVIDAARRFGARGHGIELDPRLVEKSRENARAAGVADKATFQQGDVLVSDISKATVVTVYLLPGLLYRLQARFIEELKPGTRVVSHAFPLLSWKPDRSERMRISKRHEGQGDESALFLWIVPAEVRGTWRGGGRELRIHQNYQEIEVEGAARATLQGRDIAWEVNGAKFGGRVEGDRITGELDRRPVVLQRISK
jgi:protein-L-isoaspartate O-methyltransferase